MTETQVSQLVLNKMTEAQYSSATKNATELYLTPDTPASTTVLGPVKVDGATITAQADGTISAVGGGSAPTTTWYTGTTGTTLDTTQTLTGKDFEVFKNGLLLQKGQVETITGRMYTGGAANKWVNLANTVPMSTASTWEVKTRLLFQNFSSTASSYMLSIFGVSGTTDCQCPLVDIQYGSGSWGVNVLLSSNGSSWNICNTRVMGGLTVGNTYDFRIGYNGTQYYFYHKLATDTNYTQDWTLTSASKAYSTVPLQFLNHINGSFASGTNYNPSTLYMQDTYIIVDGNTWFNGVTAVSGTDFVNNNCTLTTQEETRVTNDYGASGTELEFAVPLIGADRVAMQMY